MYRSFAQPILAFAIITGLAEAVEANVVIDFDSIFVGTANARPSAPYEEDGYRLDTDSSDSTVRSSAFGIFGSSDSGFTGENSMFLGWQNPSYSLSRVDGQPFDLISIDIWEWRNQPLFLSTYLAELTFTGYRNDSSTVQQSTIANGVWDSETFTFPSFTNVTRVEWDISDGFSALHQFDNIVVSSVPEPSSILACGIGMGVVLLSRRRIRRPKGK